MGNFFERINSKFEKQIAEDNSNPVVFYSTYNFILYSFFGWILEMIYHLRLGIIENRGFLFGPFCIIYGFGALIMILIYSKLNIKNKPLKVIVFWILNVIICTILEYVTSVFLESFFHIRLWDYSDLPYNLNGRIQLNMSVVWGNCSLVLVYLVLPLTKKLFDKLMKKKYFYAVINIIIVGMFIDWLFGTIKFLLK